jgi:hypothetical protein
VITLGAGIALAILIPFVVAVFCLAVREMGRAHRAQEINK